MINSNQISVVVQGGIDPTLTPRCLKSIRSLLPHSEIILSTWKGSDVQNLDYDKLVLSDDPGGVVADDVYGVTNNVNRQIESSKSGLKAASRRFALKIRSDMELTGLEFFDAWGKFDDHRSDTCAIFTSRIIINNLYCADPHRTTYLFHISDWAQFGLIEDVLNLWDIPLQSNEDMRGYCKVSGPRSTRCHHGKGVICPSNISC